MQFNECCAHEIQNDLGKYFSFATFDEFKDVEGFNDLLELKKIIAFSFFGNPSHDRDDSTLGYTEKQIKFVNPIYEKILNLKRFSPGQNSVCMGLLFVCVLKREKLESEDLTSYAYIGSQNILVSPVFKIRKCISHDDYTRSCCIYVDEHCREYSSWDNYLENNRLPEGVMVFPKDGVYKNISGDKETFLFDIEVALTPLSNKKWVKRVANAGIGLGLSSLAIVGGALFFPIAAPVLAVATAAGAASGAIGITTSSAVLVDRKKHGQTINLIDPESRGCWLNVVGSTLGIASGGMTQCLSRLSQQGTVIGRGVQNFCTGTFVASALTNGVAVGNGLAMAIFHYNNHGQKPTTLEILQLTSSVLFFTHSVINFQTAGTIIEQSQNMTINQQRTELSSNRHRKMFDKMAAETQRVAGDKQLGKAQVIRSMNRIDNKDLFFSSSVKINKELNLNKVKISFDDNGAVLNANIPIDPKNLATLSPNERLDFLSKAGPSQLSAKNVSTALQTNHTNYLSSKAIFLITRLCTSDLDLVNLINNNLKDFIDENIAYLEKIAFKLLESLPPLLREILSSVYYNIKEACIKFIYKTIKKVATNFTDELKSYFNKTNEIISNKIEPLLKLFENWINEFPSTGTKISCNVCGGFRYSLQ